MFFILGTPRSGTTLLTSILNLHQDVVIPDETDYIIPTILLCERIVSAEAGRRLISDFITSTGRFRESLGVYLSPDDVREAVHGAPYDAKSVILALHERLAAAAGKRCAGDKSPNDLEFAQVMMRHGVLARPTKIVHIVRDPRDVFFSIKMLGWPVGDRTFMNDWASANLRILRGFGGNADQYHLIRYEDFVKQAEQKTRAIVEFLGLPWQPDILDDARRGERHRNQFQHRSLTKPIRPRAVGQWKTAREIPWRELFAGNDKALRSFGYARVGERAAS